jgi:Ca-activated chloride channel family protein
MRALKLRAAVSTTARCAAVSFAAPAWLAGLLLIPVLVWAYLAARAHSTRYAARFPAASTLALAARAESRWLRHLPAALLLLACAALVLALARPHHTVRVPVGRASVMLVLDHSGSMQATDVQPTRLAAAERAASAFVGELPAPVRVGVVAFSSVPDAVQAPTADRAAVMRIVDSQTAVGSTATGNALALALDLLENDSATNSGGTSGGGTSGGGTSGGGTSGGGTSGGGANSAGVSGSGVGKQGADPPRTVRSPGAIVLLSDGAANAGRDPVEVATEAGARKIPIYTVALGNADATIPNPSGFGPPIAVPPDPELLQRIANASHAQSFTAQDSGRLISIYRRLGEQLGSVARSRDVTTAFALAGALLLLSAGLLALRRGGGLP